jgi:sulfhydrogenase subunit beta (sulfur reductase)
MNKIIAKEKVGEWVKALLAQAEVVAPVCDREQDYSFLPVSSPEQIAWDYTNTLQPAKAFLFPQTDTLFHYRLDNGLSIEPTYDRRARVMLGLRCCDLSGIRYLDRMFTLDREDVYWLSRRERTTLINLTCPRPFPWCFCVCIDTGPFLDQHYDAQMTDLGEAFLVEVATTKGEAAVNVAATLFTDAPEEAMVKRRALDAAADAKFREENWLYFSSCMRRISAQLTKDELWAQMQDWCLGAGSCTSLCPTCNCFNVVDCHGEGQGERCRIWDSCQFAGETREVSGHNPRAERKERIKRRFYHKLSYQYQQKYGIDIPGCVGCGRCCITCLGTTTMSTVGQALRRGAWQ